MRSCKNLFPVLGIVVVMSLMTTQRLEADTRTWKDATGDFSLEAEFVSASDGKVKLEKADGSTIEVAISKLSSGDQAYIESLAEHGASDSAESVPLNKLTGKPKELANDDGKAAGKKSFPRGIAAAFKASAEGQYLTGVKVHASRYGSVRAPREDFVVTLCDPKFKPVAEFQLPYSKFERSGPKWVTLRVKPTKVPKDFVICLNFNPTRTKGVYVSHDAEGKSLVGLPNKAAGSFTGGDWMVRALVDTLR